MKRAAKAKSSRKPDWAVLGVVAVLLVVSAAVALLTSGPSGEELARAAFTDRCNDNGGFVITQPKGARWKVVCINFNNREQLKSM